MTDPTPGNNTATDTDTPAPKADLQITKTDGSTTYTPGTGITYSIVASNVGPSDVAGATLFDAIPANVANATWTAVYSAGASGPANGTGSINTLINLASGSNVTITLSGSVLASASGNLTNTANVTTPPGVTDPTPGNNTATDTDTPTPKADLQLTKTDGSLTYTPGTAISYAIVARNVGPSDALGAVVFDAVPASIANATWTSLYGNGVAGPSGSGNINTLVNLVSGANITFTLSGTVLSGATGNLTNTANVTTPPGVTDPTPGNNTGTDTDTPNPKADLQLTKTDGNLTYTAGNAVSYTIVATNVGPSDVTGATVTDLVPANLAGATWTSLYGNGAVGPNGGGNINTLVNLASGANITFTLSGTVLSSATGNLTNTANVTTPPGVTDPTPGNNTATDTDTPAPKADLQITKTDGNTTYTPGTGVTYTIVATNVGPSDVVGATVSDTLPANLTGAGVDLRVRQRGRRPRRRRQHQHPGQPAERGQHHLHALGERPRGGSSAT